MVHLRKSQTPYWWPIPRKVGGVWSIRTSPGPHSLAYSLPLAMVMRDVLKYAKTLREARYIISKGYVKVDGRVRRNYRFPVGLMDVIEIVPTGEIYRVVPNGDSYYTLVPIPSEEANLKLLRVEGKTSVRGGKIQLHFHDGRNLIVQPEVGRQIETLGTVLYDLSNNSIKSYTPLKLDTLAVIIHGSNVGFMGKVEEIVRTLKRRESTIALRQNDVVRRTILNYTMAVGVDSPLVKI